MAPIESLKPANSAPGAVGIGDGDHNRLLSVHYAGLTTGLGSTSPGARKA